MPTYSPTLTITDAQEAALDDLVAKLGVTKAQLLQNVVEQELDNHRLKMVNEAWQAMTLEEKEAAT